MREILAYLAGVIDSDGCILITKNLAQKRAKSPQYSARINVSQIQIEAIDLLEQLYGGCRHLRKTRNHKDLHSWDLSSQQAREFLEDIYEFLRIKKAQAKVAIELELRKKLTYGKQRLSQKELEIRENMFQEIKRLKRC